MSIQSSAYVFELLLPFQNQKLFISGRVILKKQTPNLPFRSVFHHFSLLGFERAMESHGCGWDPLGPVGCGGQQRHG